jgi:hypothetical protein
MELAEVVVAYSPALVGQEEPQPPLTTTVKVVAQVAVAEITKTLLVWSGLVVDQTVVVGLEPMVKALVAVAGGRRVVQAGHRVARLAVAAKQLT